jgi:hypothetical protein
MLGKLGILVPITRGFPDICARVHRIERIIDDRGRGSEMNIGQALPNAVLAQAVRQPVIPPVVVSDRMYYIGLALLVIALVVAAIVAYRMWVEIHDVVDPDTPEELLEAFKFEKVRQQLARGERPTAKKASERRLPPS